MYTENSEVQNKETHSKEKKIKVFWRLNIIILIINIIAICYWVPKVSVKNKLPSLQFRYSDDGTSSQRKALLTEYRGSEELIFKEKDHRIQRYMKNDDNLLKFYFDSKKHTLLELVFEEVDVFSVLATCEGNEIPIITKDYCHFYLDIGEIDDEKIVEVTARSGIHIAKYLFRVVTIK